MRLAVCGVCVCAPCCVCVRACMCVCGNVLCCISTSAKAEDPPAVEAPEGFTLFTPAPIDSRQCNQRYHALLYVFSQAPAAKLSADHSLVCVCQ